MKDITIKIIPKPNFSWWSSNKRNLLNLGAVHNAKHELWQSIVSVHNLIVDNDFASTSMSAYGI